MLRGLFRTKKLDDIMAAAETGPALRRDLGAFQVTMLGIGAILVTAIIAVYPNALNTPRLVQRVIRR